MEHADEEVCVTEPTPPEPQAPGTTPSMQPPLTGPLPSGPAYPGPPPPGYGPVPATVVLEPVKSRRTAGLLGIFLGALGVHRFYLGYPSMGVLQILVTVSTLGIGGLWGTIEGVLILSGIGIKTDADGRPLRP